MSASTSRRLKTARFDIYRSLVLRTARKESENDISNEQDYPFSTNYELFTAGLAIGFLRDTPRTESKGNYSQDFIDVNRVGGASDNEYRQGIEFVYNLIKLEHPDEEPDDSDVWELALQYADSGVEVINNDISLMDEFDLLGFIDESEEKWKGRLDQILVDK